MRRSRGFTLIELMITVAIIAILVIIALPNYTEFIRRGKVSDAIGPLSTMRVRMEQFFQDNRTYMGACVAGTVAPLPTATSNFTYTCPTLSATAYKVSAIGTGSMTGFTYSIDQNNVHSTDTTAANSGWPTNAGCWVLRKDGSC